MANEDTPMSNAPPTPGDEPDPEPEPTAPVVDFSPATVPYNEAFENALMEAILNPPPQTTAPDRTISDEPPVIPASQLPVPLSSHIRTHKSPIPGVYLTHANGYHTGGPGPSPQTVKEFADSFIREHGIEDAGQLERMVESITKEKLELARIRMEKRKEAVEKNKAVERELEDLKLQRSAELRVMERVKGGKR